MKHKPSSKNKTLMIKLEPRKSKLKKRKKKERPLRSKRKKLLNKKNCKKLD